MPTEIKNQPRDLGGGAREGLLLFFPLLALNNTAGPAVTHKISNEYSYQPVLCKSQKNDSVETYR